MSKKDSLESIAISLERIAKALEKDDPPVTTQGGGNGNGPPDDS